MLITLLAVDGSEQSLRAVEHVCRLAAAGLAMDIHLLNVRIPIDSGHARMFVEPEAIEDFYREEGLAVLLPAARKLEDAGLPHARHLAVGHLADTIAQYAVRLRAGQLVMGSHGRGALTHLLLGSVASEVIKQTDVPLTLVR